MSGISRIININTDLSKAPKHNRIDPTDGKRRFGVVIGGRNAHRRRVRLSSKHTFKVPRN